MEDVLYLWSAVVFVVVVGGWVVLCLIGMRAADPHPMKTARERAGALGTTVGVYWGLVLLLGYSLLTPEGRSHWSPWHVLVGVGISLLPIAWVGIKQRVGSCRQPPHESGRRQPGGSAADQA